MERLNFEIPIHQALEAIQSCFSKKRKREAEEQANKENSLYEQIGRLQAELSWLKKKFNITS